MRHGSLHFVVTTGPSPGSILYASADRPRAALAYQFHAGIRHAHPVADAQARRRRLADCRPAAVVVLDADLIHDLRLRLLDPIARISAAQRANDGRHRPARAAADEAAETAADQPADEQSGAAGILLFDHFAHRFHRAGARRRRTLDDLIRGLRAATGECHGRDQRKRGAGAWNKPLRQRQHDSSSIIREPHSTNTWPRAGRWGGPAGPAISRKSDRARRTDTPASARG